MDVLPPEVLIRLAPYLTIRDLAACCAVSHWWRDVFGSDDVWKPRCDELIAKQLEKLECQVEPKFSTEMPKDLSLSPIGRWRLAFMRETHLWSNWIRGRFIEETTCLNPSEGLLLLDPFNYLVHRRINFKSGELKLMNVKKHPPHCVAQLKVQSEYEYFITIVSRNTVITIDAGNFVQVIDVNLEKHTFSIRHIFCIDESISLRRQGEWIEHSVRDTIFMGFEGEQIFIWDLIKGIKLKTERTFLQNPSRTLSKYCSDVVIRGYSGGYNYMIYDTKELTFLGFALKLTREHDCYILKDYIGVSNESTLKVYNYRTGELFCEVAVGRAGLYPCVSAVKDSFMYFKGKVLYQLTPSKNSTRVLLESDITTFTCIEDKLLVVFITLKQLEAWRIGPLTSVKTAVNIRIPFEVNEIFSLMLIHTSPMKLCRFW